MTLISKAKAEAILKTLPIGYYAGKKIDVKLTEGTGTFIDLMADEISIDYKMLEDIFSNTTNYDESFLEEDIRCFCYHEISHALLTPKSIRQSDIINIFEDERIESILRNYYMNVDFENFVKRVNNYHDEAPTNAKEFFYQIVRYRKGPKQFTDRVSTIIKDFKDITRFNNAKTYSYTYAIEDLYEDIRRYWFTDEEKYQKDLKDKAQANKQDNDDSNDYDKVTDNAVENNTINASDNSDNNANNARNNGERDEDESDVDFAEKQMKEVFGTYDNTNVLQDVDRILSSIKVTEKHNGSAINAYSGRFDSRSVVRQDYKWFVQQNRLGHVRAYSKLKLNLFIDCSGSFSMNDKIVNNLLKGLTAFEKRNRDFSFDLISCGIGQTIRDKHDRIQESYDGTCMTPEIVKQYKQVQQADAQNVNIVLYDGDMFVSCSYGVKQKYMPALRVFDNSHCILIVDNDNRYYVDKFCKNAKVIITDEYTEELYKNVMNSLVAALR